MTIYMISSLKTEAKLSRHSHQLMIHVEDMYIEHRAEPLFLYFSVEVNSSIIIRKNVRSDLFAPNKFLFSCLAYILAHIFQQLVFTFNIRREKTFKTRTY